MSFDCQKWIDGAADERMAEADQGGWDLDRTLAVRLPTEVVRASVAAITWEDGKPVQLEFTAQLRDGTEFRAVRVVPVRPEPGQPGVNGFVRAADDRHAAISPTAPSQP